MPLCAGDRVGPHEILARLGAGGMGEVYRDRDTRLNRDVARRSRFQQEPRAAGALESP